MIREELLMALVCMIKPENLLSNLNDLPKEYLEILDKVWQIEVNLSKKEVNIYLDLTTSLSLEQKEYLQDYLHAKNQQLGRINFIAYWEKALQELQEKVTLVRGWLSLATWYLKGTDNLVVELADELGLEILEKRQCDKILEGIVRRERGREIQVSFQIGQGQALVEKVLEEEEKKYWKYVGQVAEASQEDPSTKIDKEEPLSEIILGKKINEDPIPLKMVVEEEKKVVIAGEIFDIEVRQLKTGRKLVTFNLTDLTDSISVKIFEEEDKSISNSLKSGMYLILRGSVQYDKFSQELTLMVRDINLTKRNKRLDLWKTEKRIELHLHTKMSSMDSTLDVSKLVRTIEEWGHKGVAITDHGVVQAFPEIDEIARKKDFKIIYGVEGYLVNDGIPLVIRPREKTWTEETFVVFDLETTGLSPQTAEIIEIGAVKIQAGQIVEEFQTFIAYDQLLPPEIIKLTGINDQMLEGAPLIDQVLPKFLDFVGDSCLVAHNASFDLGFMENKLAKCLNQRLDNPILDTLTLARVLLPQLKNYKLNTLTKYFKVTLENHHRALDDARATGYVFLRLVDLLKEEGITNLVQVDTLGKGINPEQLKSYHIVILVKNKIGLENLYRLTSLAHTKYFYRVPRIPKSQLINYREGLIIGSACEAGELIQAYLEGASKEKLLQIAKFYDYLEIQPPANNRFLIRQNRFKDERDLEVMNQVICQLGDELGKPVVATGDVHFLEPEDAVYREILLTAQGFEDASEQAPLYLKNTEEMLQDFAHLGSKKAQEVVVDNTHLIADMVEAGIKPVPDEFYPPEIEGAEEQIRQMTYDKAIAMYGNPLPEIVEKALTKELNSIIKHGFSVLYLIAHKLVKKSLDDGYLVGSRGSVGSSLVAYMCDITEVNSLPPHYLCSSCKYNEFITDGSVGAGIDLSDKCCPKCGEKLLKEGMDIPFEVFLGFKGDKVPDIDLNFSGDYQPVVHKYTEELFGEGYVFKAGTVATVAEKTAYGFVRSYLDEKKIVARQAEIARLLKGCSGVKRTTGQHPGGVMVVPKSTDIHHFCPIQYPANDKNAGMFTTHFDYKSISSRLVKLDILGHDDPTAIRMLQDLTGIEPQNIPLDDQETMKIFSSLEPLGIKEEDLKCKIGTIAIPEFGTRFVRQMLEDTNPTTFSELVRIAGLSHGTDVWLNNAQELVRNGIATLPQVISTRDDIMIYLMQKGVEPSIAFKIMEKVRKGQGVNLEHEEEMEKHDVPRWYIESCKKIQYMFPKAHAAAYVMMAFRIAYFKVHHPLAFYATYFSVRADEFDAQLTLGGIDGVRRKLEEIERKGNEATAKEKNLVTVLEVILEAMLRGIEFLPVDLYQSDVKKVLIKDGKLLPPLASLQGVGESAAQSIVLARQEKKFSSIEDLRERSRVSKSVIEILTQHGCLQSLPFTNQLVLFG